MCEKWSHFGEDQVEICVCCRAHFLKNERKYHIAVVHGIFWNKIRNKIEILCAFSGILARFFGNICTKIRNVAYTNVQFVRVSSVESLGSCWLDNPNGDTGRGRAAGLQLFVNGHYFYVVIILNNRAQFRLTDIENRQNLNHKSIFV